VHSLAVSNATGSVFTAGTGTVQFNASNTLPTSIFTSFNNITFSAGTTTASTGLTVTGNITINNGGIFAAGSFTHNIAGNWTVNTGGTFIPSTGTINFNSTTAAQAINGTSTSQTFYNITVANTGQTLTTGGSETTLAIASLTVSSGTISLAGAAIAVTVSGSLTVSGGTCNVAGAGLTVSGATTISGTLGITSAGNTKTFTGLITINSGGIWSNTANSTVTIQGGITSNGTFTSGTGVYTFSINNQSLNGILAISHVTVAGVTLTNNNTLTVATALAGTGTFIQAASATLNLGGTSAITALQATNTGNLVNYTGTNQTIASGNYYDLTLSGAGTDVLQTGTTSVLDNLTLSGTVRTTTVVGLTIGNNLTTGDGTIFTAAGFALTVTGTTTIGAGVSGSMVISSATGTKTFAGLIRLNSGATWNNSGNSPVTVQGGITNSGTFTAGTGVYTFNTNNQALNGTLSIANVTVTGIALTNNNTFTVATALSGTGTLTQAANATLNLGGTSGINALQATNTGNTVNYTGAAQTVNGTNYYNLSFSGSGAKTLQAGTTNIANNLTLTGTATTTTVVGLTIAGNLSIGNGTTFTAAGFALAVTGTTTVGAGASGRITINNAAGAKTFTGLITINAGGVWANTGNSPITVQGGITNSGTFTSGTGVYTFNTNNQALTGTFAIRNVTVTGIALTNNNTLTVATTLTGTGTLTQSANATLGIGGTATVTTLQATSTGNLVSYTAAGAQTVNSANYYNLTFSGSGAKTLQTGTTSIGGNFTLAGTASTTAVAGLTIGGNIVLGAGTAFNGGAFTHNISGNWTNNGATFTGASSTISFNGSAVQTIGGTAATTFAGLTINNAASVTLNDGTNSTNKTVTGTLTLSNGYLTTTTANLLILNSGATASVANASGGVPQYNSPYVNGPMSKVGNQAFIFPVGVVGTGCIPIGISAPSTATSTFLAQYNRTSAKSLGSITASHIYDVSVCEYWTLNRTVGTSTVDVTAYWNANSPCNGETPGNYVTNLTTIEIAHFNAGTGSWDNSSFGTSYTNGGTVTGSVTWSGVSNFSPFALANSTGTQINPLAIKLDYFTAVKSNGYNILSWKAECAASSNLFVAQRSSDGVHFSDIDSVKTDAASDCSQPFGYNDYSATGSDVYYRIKMTDVYGTEGYSEIVLLTNPVSGFEIIGVNPNPVQGDATLKISAAKNDQVELVMMSIDGRELQHKTVAVPSGTSTISLQTSELSKGIYILKGIFSGGQTNTIKFVKQ